MLKYSKGQKISLNLTLINNNGSPESNADIKYEIYNDINEIVYYNNNLVFNEQLGSYIDVIDPWENQQQGIYHVKWYINNAVEDYPNTAVEELYIEEYDNKLDKILGLVHQNCFIDQAKYDGMDNLIQARMRIYSDAQSVGTNDNVLATYKIQSNPSGTGKFNYWLQVEV